VYGVLILHGSHYEVKRIPHAQLAHVQAGSKYSRYLTVYKKQDKIVKQVIHINFEDIK
jgi:hypothetical protein